MSNSVSTWLRSLGLGQYEEAFEKNAIDEEILADLTEGDLDLLGVQLLGHRKKLLKAIAALADVPLSSEVAPQPAGEAERRQLTVMFVDLVGSTSLSGRLDPEEMQEVIRAYQDAVSGEIVRFDGHVAKFMGDGVLAYFGWPRAHEDAAERAVQAGLGAIAAVSRLRAPSPESLAARVGIATGVVVVGKLVGEGAAKEESVVGETPNLAARLQSIAAPGAVVLSDLTRRLLGERFEFLDLGPQQLKGFAAPIKAWAAIGDSEAEGRFEAYRGQDALPLIGREEELSLLLSRWQLACAGEGQVVLLSGEAGIGKSRLADALREQLASEQHVRLRYFASSLHTDSAFYPVVRQLERAAKIRPEDAPQEKLDKLENMIVQSDGDETTVALVAALLSIDVGDRYPPLKMTPQIQKIRTMEALVDQGSRLSAAEPVLMIVEDAHWIDATTQELFEITIERAQKLRMLLVITFRPEFQVPWTGFPHVTSFSLNRLGRDQGLAIIDRVTTGRSLPPYVAEHLLDTADGVPLFVEELTKTVLESGLLETSNGSSSSAIALLGIPATLHDSLMARLDRLAPAKRIAQIGSVVGRIFSYELVAAAAPMSEPVVRDALDRLIESGLVFRRGKPPDATYTFKHALIQQAAYQSLLKPTRREFHARIATVLEDRFQHVVTQEPELLAHHYTAAGLSDQAITYWQRAGARALRRSANVEAINHLMKGLELLESLTDVGERGRRELPLQLALGPALMAKKGQAAPEARQAYARARELGQQVGDTRQQFQAVWGSWRSCTMQSEHGNARELAEECLRLAEPLQDVAFQIAARFALGGTSVFMGDFATARVHIEHAIPLYDIGEHRSLRFDYGQDPGASSLSYLGWTLWFLGFPERAIEKGREALELAEAIAHPFTRAQVRMYLAFIHAFCRDWPTAQSHAKETMRLSKEQGFPQTLWFSSSIHARALVEAGRLETGILELEESVAARKDIGGMAGKLFELALLAEAYGVAHRNDEGLRMLAEALDFAIKTGEGYYLPEVYRLRGELLLPQRDHGAEEEAADCFRRAFDTAHRQGSKILELRAATSLARLRREQGKIAEASDLLTPVYGWFTEGFDTPDLKEAKALLHDLA